MAERVICPRAPWTRAIGYLRRRAIEPAEALWFDHCSAIHTLGMRTPIDVVFLDREHIVVRVIAYARRNRVFFGGARTVATIELCPGVGAAGVRIGDRLQLE